MPRLRRDALAEPRLRRWLLALLRREWRVEEARGASLAAAASVPVVRGRLRAYIGGAERAKGKNQPGGKEEGAEHDGGSFSADET